MPASCSAVGLRLRPAAARAAISGIADHQLARVCARRCPLDCWCLVIGRSDLAAGLLRGCVGRCLRGGGGLVLWNVHRLPHGVGDLTPALRSAVRSTSPHRLEDLEQIAASEPVLLDGRYIGRRDMKGTSPSTSDQHDCRRPLASGSPNRERNDPRSRRPRGQ